MSFRPFFLVAAAILATAASGIASAPEGAKRPSAAPRSQADESLSSWQLVYTALAAGSVSNPSSLKQYQQRFGAWAADLRRAGIARSAGEPAARAIHEYLHAHVFTGHYQAGASDVSAVFDRGDFNCVSATILFVALADELGLETRGVELPGHVSAEVKTPNGWLPFETTSPGWPHALKRDSRADETGAGLRTGRRIDNRGLLAALYYNRGVELLAHEKYAAAAEANRLALECDPDCQLARDNLLATLNNWAVALTQRGDFSQADEVLRQGQSLAPDYAAFEANRRFLRQQAEKSAAR